jgi:hypothetical protein
MYGVELEHNISFSRVYSDYIIDKTYSEGIIAEDKMPILLTLLLVQLVKDMFSLILIENIFYICLAVYTQKKENLKNY